MNGRPILVTGAGGFVCSEIALALHRTGHDVLAVDQAFDAATTARLNGIRQIEGHLPAVLPELDHAGFSAVIHGAAITASPERLGISHARHIRRNMDLLTSTLDFARGAGAVRFLFISSMGVFEPDDGPIPNSRFTEATEPTATCTYCAAKQAGELLTTSAAEQGFATLSLRLGNIFGAHEAVRATRQHLCLVSRMLAEARTKGVITVQTPQAEREWSWLSDLAKVIAQLIQHFPTNGSRVIHAGTPPVITDLSLARAIAARVLGATIRLTSPPHDPIRPPMGSDVSSVFDGADWTGVEDALDKMIRVEVTI
jgi:UDP-glucose 4-epimerase